MVVGSAPMLQAMLITTGSGTSAKQDRPRSTPSARRLTRRHVAGLPAPRPLAPGQLAPRQPVPRQAVPRQAVPPRQSAARLPMPMAAVAGPAESCRGGTGHRVGRRPTCKLARSPLMPQPGAGSEVPPSARALAMPPRSRDFRSRDFGGRARRGTRTPRLTRRLQRCLLPPPGQSRIGRGQATTARGPMSTGRGPTTTWRGPATARPCRSRAQHGRLPDHARPDAP
jgi:hypothetical protein